MWAYETWHRATSKLRLFTYYTHHSSPRHSTGPEESLRAGSSHLPALQLHSSGMAKGIAGGAVSLFWCQAGAHLLEWHMCGTGALHCDSRGPLRLCPGHGTCDIVKLKQRCCDLVWWPGIDKDIEAFVKECWASLVSGKTSHQAPPPLQPLTWPSNHGSICN